MSDASDVGVKLSASATSAEQISLVSVERMRAAPPLINPVAMSTSMTNPCASRVPNVTLLPESTASEAVLSSVPFGANTSTVTVGLALLVEVHGRTCRGRPLQDAGHRKQILRARRQGRGDEAGMNRGRGQDRQSANRTDEREREGMHGMVLLAWLAAKRRHLLRHDATTLDRPSNDEGPIGAVSPSPDFSRYPLAREAVTAHASQPARGRTLRQRGCLVRRAGCRLAYDPAEATLRADGIRFMSRSSILFIAALGIVAVLARVLFLNASRRRAAPRATSSTRRRSRE